MSEMALETKPSSPTEPPVAPPAAEDPSKLFDNRELFINRELSWLRFNQRVLGEVHDASLPVYERLKFLTIVTSNLDEFFMVRVAGLKQQLALGVVETPADDTLPADQLSAISAEGHAMVGEVYRAWQDEILAGLSAIGVQIVQPDAMTAEQRAAARAHYSSVVFPALTPLAVDPGHPFPHLRSKSLNIAVTVRKQGGRRRYRPQRRGARGRAGAERARPAGAAAVGERTRLRLPRDADRDAPRRSLPRLHGQQDGGVPRDAQLGPAARRGGVRGPAVDDPGRAAPPRSRRGGAPRDRLGRARRSGQDADARL